MDGWKRTLALGLLGAVALTAAAAVASACGGGEEEGGGGAEATTVSVTLGEWLVEPDPDSAPAGEITFTANNEGTIEHELVIIKTDLAPDALPTNDDGTVNEDAEGIEVIDEIEEFEPGGSESLTVTLEPGKYVLICNIGPSSEEEAGHMEHEAHYKEGMHAAFTVE
ncbi:MAG TPA: hypothetical protein VNM43_08310 [Dehalococcoidia bacterium]|nr:hypothetical protein [Dehalococcoidia bacterium]